MCWDSLGNIVNAEMDIDEVGFLLHQGILHIVLDQAIEVCLIDDRQLVIDAKNVGGIHRHHVT